MSGNFDEVSAFSLKVCSVNVKILAKLTDEAEGSNGPMKSNQN